ncbi:MAG TPA: caspase family protein, partial [Spirochaetia bacterium]|nr:caspase family protein [Spirochaetia bacterium]
FTPAGDRVAVGISETAAAEIYTIRDGYLSFLADVDSSGISGGNFSSVCFSADGRYLYAGGRGPTFRRWSNAGTGPKEDLKAGNTDTILDLMALADGRMIFAAADPIWGIVGPDGAPVLTRKGEVADFMTSGLRVSDDGMKIAFRPWGENTSTTFDVTTATLTPNATVSDLTAASKDGLAVADYNDNYTPTLDGKALVLERYERSRCVSVLPDHSGLVLGSDWNVRLFDASGQQKWKTGAPATVWGVDVAPNGRTVVAEFSDGTLRWYRISDGKEIAAFFPHTDHKRWVLATASGYYDCSPGGEDLMGWIVNRGADTTPDFYPASRFRSTYYRPDIVRLTISLADEQLAIAKANEGRATPQNNSVVTLLPAVVKITSPDQGAKVSSNVVTIHYKVDVPSGDTLSGVRALVDGRPPEGSRGLTVVSAATGSGSDSTIDVPIPSRDCTVSLIAETARTTSEAATVRLVWGGNAPSDQFIIKPKLYVLAIGVSAYEKTDYRLKYAAKDATDFAAAFSGQKGVLYRDVVTKVLTDSDASRDDIMDGLDWIQKETTSKDVAAVFLSGHGVNDQNGVYYYLPVNADIDKLKRTCVPFSDIKNTVQGIAGKVLFFVDTCHSGNVMGSGRRGTGPDMTAIVNELSSAENGAVVFSSSTGSQYSLEDPSWGNGAFTKALVEGLAGKADYTGGGKITVNMLDLYISERVKQLTGGQQTPTTMKPPSVPDFPVAVK